MDFSKRVKKLGLNLEIINLHKDRIKQFISTDFTSLPKYSIAETCKTENQTVIDYETVSKYDSEVHVESLILAAGASSRYLKPLYALVEEHRGKAIDLESSQIQKILNSSLPQEIRDAMLQDGFVFNDSFKELIDESAKPKALQSCFKNNLSFLQIKLKENESYGFKKNHVIVPYKSHSVFSNLQLGENTHYYEQDEPYSTIRFNDQGEPLVIDENLSLVPAGHGGITQFIHVIKEKCPNAQGVLFRNIDNLTGDHPKVVKGVKSFNGFFGFVLKEIKQIRKFLKSNNFVAAEAVAKTTCHKLFGKVNDLQNTETSFLHLLMKKFFATESTDGDLLQNYERPINILGQVKNLGSDVGGLPCVAYNEEKKFKFCLEMSHAKDEFQETFFDPKKATHFNPVWILAEVPEGDVNYQKIAQDFWIIAKKSFQGNTVYYHETLLSEVLGNSIYFNLAFAEIPRSMFNPCKMITDTQSDFEDYFI